MEDVGSGTGLEPERTTLRVLFEFLLESIEVALLRKSGCRF